MCGVQFTIVRPGGLTVDPPTGEINVIKGEVGDEPIDAHGACTAVCGTYRDM